MPTVKYEVDKNGYLETFEVDGKPVPKEVLEVFRGCEIKLPKELPLAGLVKLAKAVMEKPEFKEMLLNSSKFREFEQRQFLYDVVSVFSRDVKGWLESVERSYYTHMIWSYSSTNSTLEIPLKNGSTIKAKLSRTLPVHTNYNKVFETTVKGVKISFVFKSSGEASRLICKGKFSSSRLLNYIGEIRVDEKDVPYEKWSAVLKALAEAENPYISILLH